MERRLNLVKSDFEQLEKRVLPRFPFCYLTFKSDKTSKVFEVKDISNSGMQLGLKVGNMDLKKDDKVHGLLHWSGRELEISGSVKWSSDSRVGVEFLNNPQMNDLVSHFLNMSEIATQLKPVHKMDQAIEVPRALRYWLRADGPVEIFVWQHNDREYERIQILMMENFIEWEDGKGLKSAKVLSKRDKDTPLITEDEYVFQVDESLDPKRLEMAQNLVSHLSADQLDPEVTEFIQLKLNS